MLNIGGPRGRSLIGLDVRTDIREVERELKAYPSVMMRASTRALNDTSRLARTAVLRAVSGASGIQQKQLKSRITRFKAYWRRQVAGVYYHHNKIDVVKAGAPNKPVDVPRRVQGRRRRRQYTGQKGAKVGKYFVEGGFVATPTWGNNQGRAGIYERPTKKRMPIVRKYIPLHQHIPLMESTAHAVVAANFRRILIHHVNYYMSKRVKK